MQLVSTPDCGSGGREFESRLSPLNIIWLCGEEVNAVHCLCIYQGFESLHSRSYILYALVAYEVGAAD